MVLWQEQLQEEEPWEMVLWQKQLQEETPWEMVLWQEQLEEEKEHEGELVEEVYRVVQMAVQELEAGKLLFAAPSQNH